MQMRVMCSTQTHCSHCLAQQQARAVVVLPAAAAAPWPAAAGLAASSGGTGLVLPLLRPAWQQQEGQAVML